LDYIRRSLLQRRRVNYNIDVAHGNFEPAAIAHVANKKANAGIRDFLGHLVTVLNSSREKTMTLLGLKSFKSRRVTLLPKDPVPPVMSTILFSISSAAFSKRLTFGDPCAFRFSA
jgi:hypothetical protein